MRDDDAVRRAKAGDAEAWGELYRAHAGRLVVWLRSRPSGDPSLSPEDIAGEAWLTAARRVSDFHGTADEFGGWLFGIARNLSVNSRRRSLRRRTDPIGTAGDQAATSPEQAAVDSSSWVSWALAQLPPRERDVLGCMEVVDLDAAATALALGISRTAVRVARHRGLARLRGLAGQTPPLESRSAI